MRFTRWFNREHDRDGHLWGAKFRSVLVEDGEEGERKGRRGIPKAEAAAVRAKEGRMGFARMLRHRVRHFTEGMALGGEGFLESVFAMNSIK